MDQHTAPFDAQGARDRLDHAARLTATTRAAAWRWVRTYLTAWAAGSIALVLAIGLGGPVGLLVGLSGWAALVTVGVLWVRRQGFSDAAAGRRIGTGAGLWSATYGAALAVGLLAFPDAVAYWVPAALVTAAPLLAAAWWPAPAPTRAPVPDGAA
ncbi:hypothetical protein [Cellulosimicrobium marinum]|uniref:hypothetical protein n=1 Tax=Cellulosimicrobium marinum TaxID=1638992 RepID=UPI001E35D4FA|nr:hypothetical protein [Cellulosimicrobium marinum]MCB7135931.1 hypothetical protein [Cellulosimicrobium marinum]